MKLSLDALLVLDAIDRKGSFAAAAAELDRVPSAVTYTVRKLEEDLDVLLFDRRGHRARLTAAGRELLEEGRHLLRAAGELESRVKRVATGWEAQLRIAYDDVIPAAGLLRLVEEFYRESCPTRVRLATEVLGGCWDALAADRADLVVGASGEGPVGGGYSVRELGSVEWVFAVAPGHPLARAPEPLAPEQVLRHRAVAVADTSRNLPPRTVGLLGGQDVLTVPNLRAKLAAQVMGLGAGNLPRYLADPEIAAGRLVAKRLLEPFMDLPLLLAWRTALRGKALRWFLGKLQEPRILERLLEPEK
ncbi:MAG TPA: LysR family transcriptional regulator [Burkholderiales bacterium]|nr:LysR family transcriptional regulator [Burkholderiales bacterium]